MKNITLGAVLIFFLAGSLSAQNLAQLEQSDYIKLENSGGEETFYAENAGYKVNNEGKVSAQILSFHENGSVAETGKLVNDKRNGTWKKYSESGALLTEASFIDGNKDGVWKVWDESGILRLEFTYDNGQRVGTWYMYDESGELLNEKEY